MTQSSRLQSIIRAVAMGAAAITLSACAVGPVATAPAAGPAAAPVASTAAAWAAPARQTSAMETDGVWVNKRSIAVRESVLPASFRQRLSMTLDVSMNLSQVVYAISRETGMRISLAPETVADSAKPLTLAGHKFNASMREVLDQITSMANMAWRYRDGAVEIFRMDTQVFEVAGAPGTSGFTHSVPGINGTVITTTSTQKDYWSSLEAGVKSLLSPAGKVSVSMESGTVTVTDSLEGVASARAYIREMNARRSKQVAMAVSVYSVESGSAGAKALSWDSINKTLLSHGATAHMVASGETAFGAILPAGFDSSEGARRTFVGALQAAGKTTVIADSSRMVLNGESAPISSLRGGAAAKEGVVMTMAPTIFGTSTVQMVASFDFAYAEAGLSTRSFIEKFSVQSGQTYVFGFRQGDGARQLGGASGGTPRTIVVTITPTIVAAQR